MFEIDELAYWFIPMIIIYSVLFNFAGLGLVRIDLGLGLGKELSVLYLNPK
jgi:hypothetical protein